jgi:hypothetical protein
MSALRLGLVQRLAIAAAIVALIWMLVAWARS